MNTNLKLDSDTTERARSLGTSLGELLAGAAKKKKDDLVAKAHEARRPEDKLTAMANVGRFARSPIGRDLFFARKVA